MRDELMGSSGGRISQTSCVSDEVLACGIGGLSRDRASGRGGELYRSPLAPLRSSLAPCA